MPSLLRHRYAALAAVALLAATAALLVSTAASAAPVGAGADGETGGESAQGPRAAGYGAGRGPVPRVVREWAAAWNTGDPQRMAALFTEDGVYEDKAFGAVFEGKEGVARWVEITTTSIDDAQVEVHDAFRKGDRIAVRWTFSGTDSAGGLGGQPPTGRSFSVPAVSVFETKGNKIERVEDYYNLADLLGQLGLSPGGAPPAS